VRVPSNKAGSPAAARCWLKLYALIAGVSPYRPLQRLVSRLDGTGPAPSSSYVFPKSPRTRQSLHQNQCDSVSLLRGEDSCKFEPITKWDRFREVEDVLWPVLLIWRRILEIERHGILGRFCVIINRFAMSTVEQCLDITMGSGMLYETGLHVPNP